MKNNLVSFSKATATFVATGACFVVALYLGSLVTIFAREGGTFLKRRPSIEHSRDHACDPTGSTCAAGQNGRKTVGRARLHCLESSYA